MNHLRQRLKATNTSVKALSQKTGISTQRIYNYITETSMPNPYTAAKIAAALRCISSDLFPEPVKVKTKLKEIMNERDMTQLDLAKLSGLSQVTINRAVNGHATMDSLNKIADALGIDVESITDSNVHAGRYVAVDNGRGFYVCPCCGAEIVLEKR